MSYELRGIITQSTVLKQYEQYMLNYISWLISIIVIHWWVIIIVISNQLKKIKTYPKHSYFKGRTEVFVDVEHVLFYFLLTLT